MNIGAEDVAKFLPWYWRWFQDFSQPNVKSDQFRHKGKKEDEELLIEKADLFEINLCEDGGRRLGDLIGCEPANGFFKLVFELTCHRQP
jgi:hypothetical protein